MELGLNVSSGCSSPWEVCLCSTQIAQPYLVSEKGLHSFKKKTTICKIISLMLVSADNSVPFGLEYVILFVSLFSVGNIIST